MKNSFFKLILILIAVAFQSVVFSQEEKSGTSENSAVISIDKEVHDYGVIEKGANGVSIFTVTNTGNAPLIISSCKKSCGCTVPTCSELPILPGETTEIKVAYDTKRVGPINKSVTIISNATNAPRKNIRIKGTVKPVEPISAPVNNEGPVKD